MKDGEVSATQEQQKCVQRCTLRDICLTDISLQFYEEILGRNEITECDRIIKTPLSETSKQKPKKQKKKKNKKNPKPTVPIFVESQ